MDYFDFESDDNHLPFTGPSTWEPELNLVSPLIQALIIKDRRAFNAFSPAQESRHNISAMQRRELRDLSSNEDVVVKPADKGGQIIIQDRANYLREAHRQLGDETFYVPLTESMMTETQSLVRECIDRITTLGFLKKKQKLYLYGPDDPRHRVFYLLPKIHKPPESWTIPHVLPKGRPIVSDCGSESYRVAEYIDHFLNPISHRHPSYIKDTYSFVSLLRNLSVPAHTLLFSADVDSLYTNIETDLGVRAVRAAFAKYPDHMRPGAQLLELLTLTLTRNDFEFNGNYYLQVCGCAMGRKYSPAYADLYMADWESEAFKKCTLKPLLYLRYLDDLFGLWTHTEAQFLEFVAVLNSHHPRIKIKHEISPLKLQFLDTEVSFTSTSSSTGTKRLATKVFFKDTDRHALLHKTSFHPRHTFRGLIKSQLIRFFRICTFRSDVETAAQILFAALKPRGYSARFLRKIRDEVTAMYTTNTGAFDPTPEQQGPLIPFVITYSTAALEFRSKVSAHFRETASQYAELAGHRFITAQRRNKNLRDLLVRARMKGERQRGESATHPPFFKQLTYVFNELSQRGVPIVQSLTLTTKNLVYCIRCLSCNILYVGETRNTLLERLKQHHYHTLKGDIENILYGHFRGGNCRAWVATGLEGATLWSNAQRKHFERVWVAKLNTCHPMGLNDPGTDRRPTPQHT